MGTRAAGGISLTDKNICNHRGIKMLQIIVAGLLAVGIIKLIEKIQKRNDYISVVGIVAATVFLAFLVNFAIAIFKLPEWYSVLGLSLYFMLPLLILRKMWELSWGRSGAYAGVILGSIIFAEVGLYLLFTSLDH